MPIQHAIGGRSSKGYVTGEVTVVISVIIPVFNEQAVLPGTLNALFAQAGSYEVIVVDGVSTDDTVMVARTFPRVSLTHGPKGRAKQMNVGATTAQGEWLLFLHADTRLPEGALLSIQNLENDKLVQAGGFRHRFRPCNWRLWCISWVNNQRCARTRVFYGDQAPFVRRSLFERLGGFPEVPVLEDVLFMEKLNQVTRPILMASSVVTDSRRFRQHGVLRSFGRVFLILSCHKIGLSIPPTKFFAEVR